jgi:RNA ligase
MRKAHSILRDVYKQNNQPFPFVEKRIPEGYSFFNYTYMTRQTFPEPNSAPNDDIRHYYMMMRECRGICFDHETGRVISRPFQKFFNINEKEETQQDKLDLTNDHHILEKMDGTMICATLTRLQGKFTTDGKQLYTLRFRTKMGWDTDPSKMLEQLIFLTGNLDERPKYTVDEHGVATECNPKDVDNTHFSLKEKQIKRNYINFCIKWINLGFTPLFEFVSPENMIVLVYEEPQLSLLALRHNVSGEYLPYEITKQDAENHQVPIIKPFEMESKSIEQVMGVVKEMNGVEGFVLRFNSTGMMYKIKSSWYVELHKTKTKSMWSTFTEPDIWRAVLDGTIDDILAEMNAQEVKDELQLFNTNVWKAMEAMAENLTKYIDEMLEKFKTRREFYEHLMRDSTIGKDEKRRMFIVNNTNNLVLTAMYDRKGHNALDFLIDEHRKKLKEAKKKVPPEMVEVIQKYSKMELKLTTSQYLDINRKYNENKRNQSDD